MKKLFTIAVLVLVWGCAPPKLPPNTSTEAKVAVYGRIFVASADSALTGLDRVTEQGVVPKDVTAKVAAVMKEVGNRSIQLADTLTAIDNAKTAGERTGAIGKAVAAVNEIQVLLTGATSPISDLKVRSVVSAILAGLSTTLQQLQLALKSGGTGDAPDVRAMGTVLRDGADRLTFLYAQ